MSDFYLTLPSHSSRTEFPNNTSNSFKIRLPHPIQLEGGGWKVGLVAISLPDSKLSSPSFTLEDKPLFKMECKRIHGDNRTAKVIEGSANCTLDDVTARLESVDGVSFMKSVISFFNDRRIMNDGGPHLGDKYELGGKRTYIKLRWEENELITDNEDTLKDGTSPSFEINQYLAHQMGWVKQRKTDFSYTLGPNIIQEFFTDEVPDLKDSSLDPDVFVRPNEPAFWGVQGENYIFSYHCNWRFVNLDQAFRSVVGSPSRSLFVYSDVGGSGVVGNQVTDLLREVNFKREGKGSQYFEPLHIQYIPVRKDTIDIIETQVAETTGELAGFGEGNTIVTLHFKKI